MSRQNQYHWPITSIEIQDIENLRKKQKIFTDRLQVLSTEFINPGMLDHPLQVPLIPEKSHSLQEFLMSQHPTGQPTKRLFHNVDPAWSLNGQTKISVVPEYRDEADMFLRTKMIPLSIHHYGSNVTTWFTMEAIIFHKTVTWDATTDQSIPLTKDSLLAISTEDIWPNLDPTEPQPPTRPTTTRPTRPNHETTRNTGHPNPVVTPAKQTATNETQDPADPIQPAIN